MSISLPDPVIIDPTIVDVAVVVVLLLDPMVVVTAATTVTLVTTVTTVTLVTTVVSQAMDQDMAIKMIPAVVMQIAIDSALLHPVPDPLHLPLPMFQRILCLTEVKKMSQSYRLLHGEV
jgi:hypothetical protein